MTVLIQYQSVTDRRADRQTDRQTDRETDGHICYCNTSACMACYATMLVKIHAWAWASWGRPAVLQTPYRGFASGSGGLGLPSPRLLCFTQPNLKSWIRPWTWCRVFHHWRNHDTISECDGQTDGQTDREMDGHLCYCNTSACMACYATVLVKIHALWSRPPDSLPGLCFWIPLGTSVPETPFFHST